LPENVVLAEVEPLPDEANRAALALQQLGFRIMHIGPTISVQGPKSLWESLFNVSFEPRTNTSVAEIKGSEVDYEKALVTDMRVPRELQDLVSEVTFMEPPEFY